MIGRTILLVILASSAFSRETVRLKRDGAHHKYQHAGGQYVPISHASYVPQQQSYAPASPLYAATQYSQVAPQYVRPAPVAQPHYAKTAPVPQVPQYAQPAQVPHVPQYAQPAAPVAPVAQYVQPAAQVAPVPQYAQPAAQPVAQYAQPAPVAQVPQYAQQVQPAPVAQVAPAPLPQYSQPLPEQVPVPTLPPAPIPEAPATEAPVVLPAEIAPATTAPLVTDAPATGRNYANAAPVTIPPVSEDLVSATEVPVPGLATAANVSAEKPKEESQWAKGSIPYVLEQIGFNNFNDLIILAGIENMFEKEGPMTVLVPPDAAFDALSQRFGGTEAALEQFNKNPEALISLLKSHVIPGVVPSNVFVDNFVSRSIIGSPLRVKHYEAEDNEWKPLRVATVNGARVVRTDIPATNGMIHIIDRPIFPVPSADIYNTLKNDPEQRFKTLVSAIETTGLVQVLANPLAGPFTVFAPTDKAFSMVSRLELAPILSDPARLAKLLQRHVVQDLVYTTGLQGFQKAYALNYDLLYIYHAKGMTKVNGANVVDADMTTVNGVIHSIDSVLGV